ncbi:MAG: hypothetical protein DMF98_01725, partial [Acidobacteria bacterium]
AVVNHIYRSSGSYTITGTLTDSFGTVVTVSTGVVVNPAILPITITPPTTPPNAGLPATFTIVVGTLPAGDAIQSVVVDWGDDTTPQNLGSISGTTTISHVYDVAKSYTVKATVTDTAGNTVTVSSFVTVVATTLPTIVITPSKVGNATAAPFTVNIQIQVTPPTGIGILDSLLEFGDTQTTTLGGLTGTTSISHIYNSNGTFVLRLTLTDTLNRHPQATATITLP